MTIAVATAISLAAEHPSALLPCPVCAAGLKGENLERHLHATHGTDAAGAPASRELHPRLRIEPDALVVHRRLGLGRRRVALPATVEIGGLAASVPSAGTTSYADDYNVPYDDDDVAAGTYLRLTASGTTIGSAADGAPASASAGAAGRPAPGAAGSTSASTSPPSSGSSTSSPRPAR